MDETEVQVTRNKRKLAQLREEGVNEQQSRDSNRRYSEVASGGVQGTPGNDEGLEHTNGDGNQGIEGGAGTGRGHGEGIRSADAAPINATASNNHSDGASGTSQLAAEMTPEEKAERERELTRQRVQRYRDKQREESQNDDFQAQNVTLHVTDVTENGNARVTPGVTGNANVTPEGARFQLKMPFAKEPEKVKLFTNKEAEEELEKLTFIYTKGSQLLDEVLEIVVKGHEKVQIWELSDGEAQMLADMHLDKAKQDQGAARSARALLSLYDRMYTIMLIGPRVMATGRHVKEHGGLSFK